MKKLTFIFLLGILLLGCNRDFLTPNPEDCDPLPQSTSYRGYHEFEPYRDFYFAHPHFNPNNPDLFTFHYVEVNHGTEKIGIGNLEKRSFYFLTEGEQPN